MTEKTSRLLNRISFGERCDDNALHLQCTPIKHTCLTLYICLLHFPKGKQFRKLYGRAQDFINVQSCQISLWITVNGDHTKEVPLLACSYIAPPVSAIRIWEARGLSLTYQAIFTVCMQAHQTHTDLLLRPLSTSAPSLFLNCIPSCQFDMTHSEKG